MSAVGTKDDWKDGGRTSESQSKEKAKPEELWR